MDNNKTGKIIFIHGASSSGKTTLALALQQSLDEPFWHYSIDHFRDAGILPMPRIKSGEFNWQLLRDNLFSGFHHSIRSFCTTGNNLIIEHIIDNPHWLTILLEQLVGIDIFFIELYCPLEELKRREAARGDRPAGSAEQDYKQLPNITEVDLQVNSSLATVKNVSTIINAWQRRSQPNAFTRMYNARV